MGLMDKERSRPICTRIPPAFTSYLNWLNEAYNVSYQSTNRQSTNRRRQSTNRRGLVIAFCAEHIFRDRSDEFKWLNLLSKENYLNPAMTTDDVNYARNCQPLNGVHILNLGGTEAILFSDLGADVYYVDKQNTSASLPSNSMFRGRLDELEGLTRKSFNGWADYVMSSKVFSPWSGMVDGSPIQNSEVTEMWTSIDMNKSEEHLEVFEANMNLLMEMTKPGGIHLHTGSAMNYLAGLCATPEQLVEIDGGFEKEGRIALNLFLNKSTLHERARLVDIEPLMLNRVMLYEDAGGMNMYILQRK